MKYIYYYKLNNQKFIYINFITNLSDNTNRKKNILLLSYLLKLKKNNFLNLNVNF